MPIGNTAQSIIAPAKMSMGYSEMLLKGIEPHMFARKPTWGIGGAEIDCNHAAWVYGHLALYWPRLIALAGGAGGVGGAGNTGTPAVPANFEPLFKNGTRCVDDPHGNLYPPMETIIATYLTGYKAAIATVERMSDADLARPNPNAGMADRLPTIGAMANFLLSGHVMSHLGQVSTWRRCMGLGGVM
jgi:hypothetical protein